MASRTKARERGTPAGGWGAALVAAVLAMSPALARAGEQPGQAFDCLLEASARIKVGAQVSGLVSRVAVDRGDVVEEGQVVAELDSSVEAAQLALAEAKARNDQAVQSSQRRLEFLQRKQGRLDKLRARQNATFAQFDEAATDADVAAATLRDAEHNLELARLEVERARALVEQRRVRSPISGIVVERLLAAGEYRNEQSPLLVLAKVDPLYVEAVLPAAAFGRVAPGMTGVVMPEQPVGGSYAAKVLVVDQIIDGASGTFGVRLALPNAEMRVPAGLRCRVSFGPAG